MLAQGKNIAEFVSVFECPLTKSTSSSSFGNGMDIEISQKTKIQKILLRIAQCLMTEEYLWMYFYLYRCNAK